MIGIIILMRWLTSILNILVIMDLDIIVMYENGMFDQRRFNNMAMIQFFYFYVSLYVHYY